MNQHTLHNVRVAVVQCECHPSFTIGGRDYTTEPFFPESGAQAILSRLRAHAFPVRDLQLACKKEYTLWHLHRITNILKWLEGFKDPYWGMRIPDIIVFPEGSIPPEFLGALAAFAREHECVIFAGSHSLVTSEQAEAVYDGLSFWHDTIDGLAESVEELKRRGAAFEAELHKIKIKREQVKGQHDIWESMILSHIKGRATQGQDEDVGVHTKDFVSKRRLLSRQLSATSQLLASLNVEQQKLVAIIESNTRKIQFCEQCLHKAQSTYSDDMRDAGGIFPLPEEVVRDLRVKQLLEWRTELSDARDTLSVLPIIRPSGHIHFRVKQALSPYELTGQVADIPGYIPTIATITLNLRNSTHPIVIAPYVCAEALRVHRLDNEHIDLAVVVSFNKDFGWFEPIVQHTSSNRIPVLYANDGRYGDSGVIFLHDNRSFDKWWLGPTNRGRLPQGDSVLVMDVTCGAALDKGTPNTGQPYALIGLASVVPRNPNNVSFLISDTLRKGAEEAATSGYCSDTTARALLSLSERPGATRLQLRKLERLKTLLEAGAANSPAWRVLGNDCIFDMSTIRY